MNPTITQFLLPSVMNYNSLGAEKVKIFRKLQDDGLACIVPRALLAVNNGNSFRSLASFLLSANGMFAVSKNNQIVTLISSMEEYEAYIRPSTGPAF